MYEMGTLPPFSCLFLLTRGSGYTGNVVCSGHRVCGHVASLVMFRLSLLSGQGVVLLFSIIITISLAVIIPLSPWKYTASHQTCPSSLDN